MNTKDCPRGPLEPIVGRLYAERDVLALKAHYMRHTAAMTAEGLHDKGDIAAELAWRDSEIERLQADAVWRQIETAPCDDTMALVWFGNIGGGYAAVHDLDHDSDPTWWAERGATHWMPMPQPPNA